MSRSGFLAFADSPSTRERVRAFVEADPAAIFDIAAEIGDAGGELPAQAVSEAVAESVPLLARADKARLRMAVEAMLMGRDVDVALEWLRATGALAVLLPEVIATVDLVQETGRQHKDVWAHTKQVVKQTVRRPLVRWAAMLHDIGKVPTRTFTSEGVHFHGHAEVGARMFEKLHGRFAFARDEKQTIKFLVRHHLRTSQYGEAWTDSAVRRFGREMGPHMTDLLDLSRADITSKRPGRRKQLLEQISLLADRTRALAEADAILPPLPGGVGNAIMTAFAIAPSRLIGDLKRHLEQAIERGELEARREDAYYVGYLARQDLVPGADPARVADLAATGGLTEEEAADAAARAAAGLDDDGPGGIEPDDHDGDPGRPRPGVLACGHDPDNDPCAAVGEYD